MRRYSLSALATLPRAQGSGETVVGSSASDSPTGKYRKNVNKHARRASESTVIVNNDTEEKKSKFSMGKMKSLLLLCFISSLLSSA